MGAIALFLIGLGSISLATWMVCSAPIAAPRGLLKPPTRHLGIDDLLLFGLKTWGPEILIEFVCISESQSHASILELPRIEFPLPY